MHGSRGSHRLALFAISAGLVLALATCTPSAHENPRPYNILLISVDTLRADHLSLYGYPRPTSPNLEKLAKESVVFEQFINNGGFTLPSHMSLMTSMRPEVHGVSSQLQNSLPDRRTTLAEVLHDAGFTTAAFVDAGWVRRKFGFGQGFEIYDDDGGRLVEILPKAYAWLREHHQERFFLFLHTFDVHSQWGQWPYHCPGAYPRRYLQDVDSDFDGCKGGHCGTNMLRFVSKELEAGRNPLSPGDIEHMMASYDGCINYVDDEIGQLLDRLRELEIYDRTLIVVLSDHGEEFLDHGQVLHQEPSFYEELIHIPLIVKFPHAQYGGRRVSQLASMIDVLPTTLDVLSLETPKEAQGHSLMPSITTGEAVRQGVRNTTAIRTLRWKYDPKQRLLFDLVRDPVESENLFFRSRGPFEGIQQTLEDRLRSFVYRDRLRRWQFELDSDVNPEVTLTDEQVEELQALGYL